jgi:hypothetical protein
VCLPISFGSVLSRLVRTYSRRKAMRAQSVAISMPADNPLVSPVDFNRIVSAIGLVAGGLGIYLGFAWADQSRPAWLGVVATTAFAVGMVTLVIGLVVGTQRPKWGLLWFSLVLMKVAGFALTISVWDLLATS